MRSATRFALALSVWAGACSAEEAFPPPARLTIPPEAVLASLGELEDSTGSECWPAPGWRPLPDGPVSGVGEIAVPPFLRVLDRETGAARSFGPRGAGPGELTSAYALAFMGDSTLLVLSHQRVERFSVTGEWLAGRRAADAGLLISSLTTGCGGRVFAYGVPARHDGIELVPWVFEIEFDPEFSAKPLLWIPGRASPAWGALFGFDGGGEGVVLWHKFSEPEVGYWIPCDGSEPTVWSHAASRDEVEAVIDLGNRGGMVLTLPDTLFQGAAARGDARIRARMWDRDKRGSEVTSFQVVDAEGCREVEFVGS